jgi:hypothetical protein
MTSRLRAATLILLATTAFSLPTRADDVPPVVSAIMKTWEQQLKAAPTYEKVTSSGSNVTLTNVSAASATGGPSSTKVTVATIDLQNVGAEANGMIPVGSAKLTDTKAEISGPDQKGVTIAIPEVNLTDWVVAVPNDAPTPQQAFRNSMAIAKKMATGPITITSDGQSYQSGGYTGTWDGDVATGAGKYTMELQDIVIPEQMTALADTSGQLRELGYTSLAIGGTGGGEVTINGDTFGMSGNVKITSKDMAGLTISYSASDIPMAVMVELQAAQKSGKEPDFSTMMPQLMNVTINSLALRFDDASITGKLLPVLAKRQGLDQAAMIANAGAMVQVGLMQLKSQAFTDQAVAAINAFLKAPKSITIAAAPAAPVKVQQLMTLDPNNPAAAIELLGVKVTAND